MPGPHYIGQQSYQALPVSLLCPSPLSSALTCMQMRALAKKANKTEKLKNAKGGHQIWSEIGELGALIRWDLIQCLCKMMACS